MKRLPKDLENATRAVKHFRSWSGIDYYEQEIARMWEDYKVHLELKLYFLVCKIILITNLKVNGKIF